MRGGDELGYGWYEDGKLEKRTNTFNDFVDCARFLVAEGRAAEGGIGICGGSAGGELVGAVVNQAPGLFRAAAAHVPFVDVLHTILDGSLPLTPLEWPEWGNPIEDEQAFENIRSYCPYQNTGAQQYPPLLVTAGLSDPRVTYWEPAKWVAKLRELKTDENVVLLKTNMEAGHGGKSGRFDSLREVAEEQAFMLLAFGLVLMTNALTVKLAFLGAALAAAYPFFKRFTHLPQVVLGIAFGWGIPMAFAAETGAVPALAWWLLAVNTVWAVVYDTLYAMVDRDDDLSVGIKSTAILFGTLDRRLIGLMQLAALGCFIKTGSEFDLGWPYLLSIFTVALLFAWHQWLIRHRDEAACFRAFNQSKWIGVIILLGIVGHFWLTPVSAS